jgi:hypothetical protein
MLGALDLLLIYSSLNEIRNVEDQNVLLNRIPSSLSTTLDLKEGLASTGTDPCTGIVLATEYKKILDGGTNTAAYCLTNLRSDFWWR